MKKNLLKATGMLLLMLAVGSAWGQIAAWQLNGHTGSEVTVDATTLNNNLFPCTLSRGSGIEASSLLNSFSSNNFTDNGTKTDAISFGDYLFFEINVKPNYAVSLSTLDAKFRRSSTGPNTFRWQYSINGIDFTDIGSSDISYASTTTNGDYQAQIDLSGISSLQNVPNSITITIRLLGWGAIRASGSFAIGRSTTSATDDYSLEIGGYVSVLWKTNAATTNWAIGSNWDDGNIPTSETNVIIPAGALNYPTIIETDNAVCNNITIEDGASIKGAEYLAVSGTSTMQRSISAYTGATDGWHLLSSPVGTFSINGSSFDPATNDDFYGWSENTYTWMNHKVGDPSQMVPGTGYLVSYETTTTKDFTGSFNSANIPLTNLSKTVGQGNGWHLLGNPFQSALHWTNSPSTWNPTAIGTGAKIMNSGGSYTDITSDGDYQYIPANQGFFVQATDATNSITIPLDERTHNSTAFYKSTVQNSLTLKASDGEFYVETWIQMMEGATEDYDAQFDVNFLGGMYNAPYLYSMIPDEGQLSTNRIAPVTQHTTVPLAFKSFLDREYTITADNASSFGDNMDVMLEDTQENIKINLKEIPEYTFMATADELSERFIVHFFNVTAIPETTQLGGLQIYSYNNRIYLHSELNTIADVTVYNMLGQEVHQTPVELSGLQSFDLNLNTGWYVVQVLTEQGVKSEKVFIN